MLINIFICQILYTHQKQKKAKTWHDGILKHSGTGTKVIYMKPCLVLCLVFFFAFLFLFSCFYSLKKNESTSKVSHRCYSIFFSFSFIEKFNMPYLGKIIILFSSALLCSNALYGDQMCSNIITKVVRPSDEL